MEALLLGQKIRDSRGRTKWLTVFAVSVAWITFLAAAITGVAAAWNSFHTTATSADYSSYVEKQSDLIISQLSHKTWLEPTWFGDNGAVLDAGLTDDAAAPIRVEISNPQHTGSVEINLTTQGTTTFMGMAYDLGNGALLSPLPSLVKLLPNGGIRVIIPGQEADDPPLMTAAFARNRSVDSGYGPLLLFPAPLVGFFAYLLHKRGMAPSRQAGSRSPQKAKQQTV